MSYNRIQHLVEQAPRRSEARGTKKPAFVPVPHGVMAGGLQPWQMELYGWARDMAEVTLRSRVWQRRLRAAGGN